MGCVLLLRRRGFRRVTVVGCAVAIAAAEHERRESSQRDMGTLQTMAEGGRRVPDVQVGEQGPARSRQPLGRGRGRDGCSSLGSSSSRAKRRSKVNDEQALQRRWGVLGSPGSEGLTNEPGAEPSAPSPLALVPLGGEREDGVGLSGGQG